MPSYKDYVEPLILFDSLPTYEPTEYHYTTPSPILSSSDMSSTQMQYIIVVSMITSIITTCIIFYAGKCVVYIRTELRDRYLDTGSSISSHSSDSFEFENIYIE